ncbi:MAG: gamma-glutamylcyclotransferase [Candidatus Paceibacterota bacterium]
MNILLPASPNEALELIPLFVYGTLRNGGDLHAQLMPYIRSGAVPATITGRLAKAAAGDWPVLLEASGSDQFVIGEVYLVDASSLLLLLTEELLYGYSLTWAKVRSEQGFGWAVVCNWPWTEGFDEVIPHGDWLRYLAERVRSN